MTDLPTNSHRMLRFDWEVVDGRPVTAVLGLPEPGGVPGRWEAIAILVGDEAVRVSVDGETDQILVTHGPFAIGADEAWRSVEALSFAVGRPLGWCWQAANGQGYLDVFLVAFGDEALQPSCLFLAEASCLKLMNVSPMV